MKFALLLPLVLFCSTAFSQPVIEWADHPLFNSDGVTTYIAEDAEGTVFDLGSFGATDNVFHFESFAYQSPGTTSEYMAPAATPHYSAFPTATRASKSQSQYGPAYSYAEYKDNVLYNLGMGVMMGASEFLMVISPPQPALKFPLKLGDSWDYTSNPTSLFPGLTQVLTSHSEVVSAGAVVTPAGSSECLVLKVTDILDEAYFNGTTTDYLLQRSISYSFISKSGVSCAIAIDTLDAESATPHLINAAYSVPMFTDAVADVVSPGNLSLSPAYPNPVTAGADAALSWSNESRAAVRVAVFDALGREAAVLYDGVASPGVHTQTLPTGALPPGMYFVRMQNGATVLTTPVVVQR